MAVMSERAVSAFLITTMLVFGSWNTINTKLQFQICAPTLNKQATDKGCGYKAGQMPFDKPWVQTMVMFLGEAALILVYIAGGASKGADRRSAAAGREVRAQLSPGIETGGRALIAESQAKTPFYIFAVPAFCDVFGTGLAAVSMQYLDSAIWQMLRSSIIIFSALLSVLFLRRRLQPFHWVATFIVFIGLVCVGVSSSLDAGDQSASDEDQQKKNNQSQQLLGIALVIGAQVCAAFQMVFEEKLLTGRAKTSAKKVVGMEGLWGLFFVAVILVAMNYTPGDDNGSYESIPDSMSMILGSVPLLILFAAYMASISIYNLTGIIVGKKMSAVVRCLVDSCRTIVVWVVNLILHYCIDPSLGPGITAHTWLQTIGFLILVLGTLLYNEVLPPPMFLRSASSEDELPLSRTTSFVDSILHKVDLTEEDEGAGGARGFQGSCTGLEWPRAHEGRRAGAAA